MAVEIPFNRASAVGSELAYVSQAIAGGRLGGGGPFSKRVESLLEERLGAPRVLITTSCTAALEMAALLCDVGPGDEVIVPSFTFVSTANAFVLRGATPVFVDVRPDTMNLDERLVEAAVSRRTRAIVPVHYGGVACEMDAISAIAARHGLKVIEDAAHGLFARYCGLPLGTLGDLGCLSFHETKNVSCGEGGALVINDPALAARAEILREKGANRSRFLRGEVDRYTWLDVGSSYEMSDLLAAFLLGQLEKADAIVEQRRKLSGHYVELLQPLAERGFFRLAVTPEHCSTNHHVFYLLLNTASEQAPLIAHLRQAGILAVSHYQPLHSSPFALALRPERVSLPVTDDVSDRLLRLPMYYELSMADVARIAARIGSFFGAKLAAPARARARAEALSV
jgi:dTDP-4-amino-4,6-dideoxygalactose transaminase